MYGTVPLGNAYFNTRLESDTWEDAGEPDQIKALEMATRIIDKFNFLGEKTDTNQTNQFPRGGDTDIPANILQATYEIALKLLDGYDPDMESENSNIQSNAFATVKNTYDRSFVPEYLVVGVPSATAWNLLLPYLRNSQNFSIVRV